MGLFQKDAELGVPSLPEKAHVPHAPAPADLQSHAVGPYANIGQQICIRGEVTGAQDLYIAGELQGSVRLPAHLVTVGASGVATADVQARNVLVIGRVIGSVVASECVEVEVGGVVDGELAAPRLIVHEGAILNGKVTVTGPAQADGAQDSGAGVGAVGAGTESGAD